MNMDARYCPHCGAACASTAISCIICHHSLATTVVLASDQDQGLVPQREIFPSGHVLKERYRLLHPVGHGGFGTVYKALDLLNEQYVAAKVIYLTGLTPQQ